MSHHDLALHACERLYELTDKPVFGDVEGICRITGKQSVGQDFNKWVRPTFTEYASLYPGTIISNAALFCFQEKSEYLALLLDKEKGQTFRNYSHIILDGKWMMFTKAHKKEIYEALLQMPQIVCVAESGQKHIFFKSKEGFWNFEGQNLYPKTNTLKKLMGIGHELLALGFTQTDVTSGIYNSYRLYKYGFRGQEHFEAQLKPHRNTPIFNLFSHLLYKPND